MIDLPDNLDAHRYKVRYKNDEKVYILVSVLENVPVEVFASFSTSADHENFYTHAGWSAITRLASMCLRSKDMGLEETIKQLDRSSFSPKDAPGVLSSVLKKYVSEDLPKEMMYDTGGTMG